MPKQEILPPLSRMPARQEPVRIKTFVPTEYRGGPLTSTYDAFVWNKRAKAVDALARINNSEAALVASQTALVEKARAREEALFNWQDDREKRVNELQIRRVERAEMLRQAQHSSETNEMQRTVERTRLEADITVERTNLTRTRVALTDAEQQLQAQKDHGYLTYELSHRKTQAEILDVELSKKERRRLLQMNEPRRKKRDDDDYSAINAEIDALGEIDDALHARRDQLNASGLDTDGIDKVIRMRKR